MKLKSFIEKTILVNETVDTPNGIKNPVNKNYSHGDELYSSNELEDIFSNLIQYTEDRDLKLGLKIILKLISHKNVNIRNLALSKIYFMIGDEYIQQIILKELKRMPKNGNNEAEYVLESIALEIFKFEILDITFDLLTQILSRIKIGLSKIKFLFSISYDLYEIILTNIKQIYYRNVIKNHLKMFWPQIDVVTLSLEEIENISNEELKSKMIIDSHIKFNEKDSIKNLANLYAFTFTEKGHLRRLFNLLDDRDYEIQQMGVDSLIKVVNINLRNSNDKKLLKSGLSSPKNKYTQATD